MRPVDTRSLDALGERALTAAVSSHFDPFKLLKVDSLLEDGPVDVVDGLAAVCDEVDVPGSAYRHWAMRPEARRQLLLTMAARPDFTTLLDKISAPADDIFALYLLDGLHGRDLAGLLPPDGKPAPGASADLDSLLRAVRLLDGLPNARTATPDLERRVRRQIAIAEADKALQAVVPTRLVGRDRELAQLVAYRSTSLTTDRQWVPSFVLVGPGGVGKSALVSTFVSDQRRQPGAAPLIYFDFDRATLIEATPLDLTFEFTRQLGLTQFALDEPLSEFRDRTRSLLGGRENLNIDIGAGVSAAGLRDLASLLSAWPVRLAPVTIVLDTFEDIAVRGVTAVRDVLQWVAELRTTVQIPQLHLIVSGREVLPYAPNLPPDEVKAMFDVEERWELELKDLEPGDAVEMLVMLGVDPTLAQRLPPVFGGNPLVLKLLHRFVQANDRDDVEQLIADGQRSRREAPSGEVGLRFVYERILNRIKTPRVKALAYPGVVLRRVTPELIRVVLAPNCGGRLDVSTPADAEDAFSELAEHVWLVNRIPGAPDTVVHRADVRRLLVPGLEHSTEVDTKAIHRDAAAYYATPPPSVPSNVAEIEAVYHRGFLDDFPDEVALEMTQKEADDYVRQLGADLEYWPVRARATLKSRAGRHLVLSEEEVATLSAPLQRQTRGVRIEKQHASADIDSAAFEEGQLEQFGGDDETGAAIPDSRWALLFDRGDFDFMTESSRVLSAFDRYFALDRPVATSSSPTHDHPWYIALAVLIVERGQRPIFSDSALSALDASWETRRWYGAALATLGDDRSAHGRIFDRLRTEIPPRLDLSNVDDVIVYQAASSGADPEGLTTTFQAYSYDHFRLSHLSVVATAAEDHEMADRIAQAIDTYSVRRPDTAELNHFRQMLTKAYIKLEGTKELRSAPTTLSFLYGAIRTIVAGLDRTALVELVGELEQRSVFWPADLTANALGSTLRATIAPTELTVLIEMADRCGLIVDLIDAVSARATTRLSVQLAAGIRRLEGLLFPFATPRAESPLSG